MYKFAIFDLRQEPRSQIVEVDASTLREARQKLGGKTSIILLGEEKQ